MIEIFAMKLLIGVMLIGYIFYSVLTLLRLRILADTLVLPKGNLVKRSSLFNLLFSMLISFILLVLLLLA